MLDAIEASLKKRFNGQLVDELLNAYQEAKHNFYLGGLRLSEVEGGRFCEAALRMLEELTIGKFTALNRPVNSENIIASCANQPGGSFPDSIRLHVPRAIRVVYDIRNTRDAAHLAPGDIDPNLQDATLVVTGLDWIMAEFVRLYHGTTNAEAQRIVDGLVARKVPSVQDFDGFLKVLNPGLKASEYVLLLLYERGTAGATYAELEQWVHPSMRQNLRRTLKALVDGKAFVHQGSKGFLLTRLGMQEVERRNLHGMK